MKKEKVPKYVTIEAPVGGVIITPKELKLFKKYGIDVLVILKTIQTKLSD